MVPQIEICFCYNGHNDCSPVIGSSLLKRGLRHTYTFYKYN